jgi:hypothetical protein
MAFTQSALEFVGGVKLTGWVVPPFRFIVGHYISFSLQVNALERPTEGCMLALAINKVNTWARHFIHFMTCFKVLIIGKKIFFMHIFE